ncbi:MAG: aminotransferase class V-fold PLP-dependent enzyme [Elusimicrobiota bacterium]
MALNPINKSIAERLDLSRDERAVLWTQVAASAEAYLDRVSTYPIHAVLTPAQAGELLRPFDFKKAVDPGDALRFVTDGLSRYAIHTSHPRYFGLFNPASSAMGIFADALTAAYNPQLVTWNSSSFAVALEQHLLRSFGERFGYERGKTDGTFTSGGAEANHTALLTALVSRFPEFDQKGVRALEGQPVFYTTAESHHSLRKAARCCGLGTDAVVEIPADRDFKMDVEALRARIKSDRELGRKPFLIVATAGTTNGGAIDPLQALADIATEHNLWYHVDAAWGGAAVLVPELQAALSGIERADSITFDAHKWLSLPMGAGMYLTRHPGILEKTFHISASYMPAKTESEATDPYTHSLQWSRRFIGLKLFLTLAAAGWKGYAEVIAHQAAMGALLKRLLEESRWKAVNSTPLPVICFTDTSRPDGSDSVYLDQIAARINDGGEAWISTTRLAGRPVLRACICNYRTTAEDVRSLVNSLNAIRTLI